MREIVEEIQSGKERAQYGEQVLDNLSKLLSSRYGKGYSAANLKNFRQFYLVFQDRLAEIRYPAGSELLSSSEKKGYPMGGEFNSPAIVSIDKELQVHEKSLELAFSPRLSWSHYRALIK